MTAQEWREKARAAAEAAAVELELPSGMVILARRPGPLQFAQWDRLPLVLAMVEGGGRMGADEAAEITVFMRELLVYCCLEPRVSVTPGADEIHPREIPEPDWQFLVGWAMRLKEAESIRPFRRGRNDVAGDGGGEAVRVPAVGAAGDRGPGPGAGGRPGGGPAHDAGGKG